MPLVAKHRLSVRSGRILFEDVASILAQKLSTLFAAPVLILDEEALVVASSAVAGADRPLAQLSSIEPSPADHIPFRVEERCGEVILGPLPEHSLEPHGLMRAVIGQLIQQIVSEPARVVRRSARDRLVHDLLRGHFQNELEITERAELLRVDLNRPRHVILFDAYDYVHAAESGPKALSRCGRQRRANWLADNVAASFPPSVDPICAYLGEGRVAVLLLHDGRGTLPQPEDVTLVGSPVDVGAIEQATRTLHRSLEAGSACNVEVGIGRYYPGLSGLARSFADAESALTSRQRANDPGLLWPSQQIDTAAHNSAGTGDAHPPKLT
jgi:carbohydrate diacid regulator